MSSFIFSIYFIGSSSYVGNINHKEHKVNHKVHKVFSVLCVFIFVYLVIINRIDLIAVDGKLLIR